MPHRQPSSSPDQAVGRPLSSWAGGCSWQCVELEKVRIPNVIRGCWPSSTVCVQQGGFVSKNFLLFGVENRWEKVHRSSPEFTGVGRRDTCRIAGYEVLGVLRSVFAKKTNRIIVFWSCLLIETVSMHFVDFIEFIAVFTIWEDLQHKTLWAFDAPRA